MCEALAGFDLYWASSTSPDNELGELSSFSDDGLPDSQFPFRNTAQQESEPVRVPHFMKALGIKGGGPGEG